MIVKHRLHIRGRCPVDGKRDKYRVTVKVARVLKVEDILAAVAELTAGPVFQEDLTVRLAQKLAAAVKTVGRHSGVKTVCRA